MLDRVLLTKKVSPLSLSGHSYLALRRWIFKGIPILLLLYLLVDSFLIARHELTLKRSPRVTQDAPDAGWLNVPFTTTDSIKLAGWYAPTRNGQTVVLLHGHAGNRSQVLPVATMLRHEGFGVFLYDTRAHGASEGEAIGYGEKELLDLRAALDWLEARTDVDVSRIGVYGFSLGGYFALRHAVSDRRISSLVLAGTPSSLLELARDEAGGGLRGWMSSRVRYFANRIAGRSKFEQTGVESITALDNVSVLLITGGRDSLVPHTRGLELFKAARGPKSIALFPEAGHGNYLEADTQRFHGLVVNFFRRTLSQHNSLSGR